MIKGKTVRLRSFELSDLDELMKYWNNLELRNLVGSPFLGPSSRNDEEEWIRTGWKERNERKSYIMAIERLSDAKLIGSVALRGPIDWVNRYAMLGIAIYDPENWGKGYGHEAINLALKFAFQSLNLNRVELQTFDFNERAKKCFNKVGFKEIGRRRKSHFIDGKFHDAIVMDILREEWEELRTRIM